MTDVLVIIGFIAVVLGFLSNVLSFENNRRQFKEMRIQGRMLVRKAIETHDLVNSNHDDMVARVDQLTGALTDADVPVPANGKGGLEHVDEKPS
jgi:hypothetical protein